MSTLFLAVIVSEILSMHNHLLRSCGTQLEQFSNRIGRYFRTRAFSRNDSIALVMEGRPEYIGTWLGLSKVGLVAALVNTNLRHETLLHSINTADCKAVIFGSELKDGKDTLKRMNKKYFNRILARNVYL